jgi:hypothetical protein
MGSIDFGQVWGPTWLEVGFEDILIFLILLGPIIALVCIFGKNISPFLKRISIIALVIMFFLVGLALRNEIGILWAFSFLSWLYVLLSSKVRKT